MSTPRIDGEEELGVSAVPADRATRASPRAPTGLGHSASVTDAAHTPGPWVAERRRHCSVVLQGAARRDGYSDRVAECPQWSPAPYPQPTPDEAFANARLIAAAPDLYAALDDAAATFERIIENGDWRPAEQAMEAARAALSKAKGEQP